MTTSAIARNAQTHGRDIFKTVHICNIQHVYNNALNYGYNSLFHIIFSIPVLYSSFVMAVLHSRCGHYIFTLWFLSIYLIFPRLISAAANWMSTILPHMVWP